MIYTAMIYQRRKKQNFLTEIDHINDLTLLDGDGYYSSKDGYFVFDTESRQTRQLPIDADGKTQYGPLKKSGDFLYYALSEENSDEVTYYRLKDDKSEELMKLSTERHLVLKHMRSVGICELY